MVPRVLAENANPEGNCRLGVAEKLDNDFKLEFQRLYHSITY
jgi:hypothetical protein